MKEENNKSINIEMIKGDPKKAILKLSFPMMISMFLLMLYNLADSIWVSGLGPKALAAIGFISPLFMIIVGLGNGFGAGTNSLIARFIGADNDKEANNAALHGILLSLFFSIISSIFLVIFMKPILIMIGAKEALDYALDYSYIIFSFLTLIIYLSVASAIFRSEGDMKRSTIAIAITSILNIILDPIFIYEFNMGISGAAWSTVISVFISCCIMSYWIWGKRNLYLDLSYKNFNFDPKIIIDILNVSLPSTLEIIIFSGLIFFINSFLVVLGGHAAVAVYTAAMRIIQLSNIPLTAIGISVLTISGVAYGASNPEKLKTTLSYGLKLSYIFTIITVIIIFLFSSNIASIFTYSSASASLAPKISAYLKILCLFVVTIPLGYISCMVFQGVGKGINSLFINLLRAFILETLFAYIFGFILKWRIPGIYAGIVIGCLLGGVIGLIWSTIYVHKFEKEHT